ncbi:serine hydrolase family protein [Marivibrio halodurans]|uniref:Serine hydrolase family protein n=1 Tax=Marivibrio halodurans TaxID=2039722 RepID=A0A8J7S1Z7_9PROT|nr:alpha/beta hydrolase [Marivibrio halodurans]MBP5858385.1 serine hydrolase family protein [Marivibrio halodurans]
MIPVITLPGIGGSGPTHWQSAWEAKDPTIVRFQPARWDRPDLADWIASLDSAVAAAPAAPLLVAHSLACLLVAHWAARGARPVRGAFLVCVPDPRSAAFPVEAREFDDVPGGRLPFPALVVASTDDPFGTIDYSKARAEQWGAGHVSVGAHGHLNAASNLGDWPQGTALFEAFRAGTGRI